MLRIKALGRLVVLGDDGPLTGSAAQPRRLALLAVIARAGSRGITRAKIIELLWPESDEDHGRGVLSKALSALRRDLGAEDAFLGSNNDVRLNPTVISTDLDDFGAAITAGRLADAAALYVGPFLDGFRVAGAVEFERWAAAERAAVEAQYVTTLAAIARAAGARGDHTESVRRWRELASYQPLDTQHAIGLMNALVAAGEPRAALEHARLYELLVTQSLDVPADQNVIALADRIREGFAPASARAATPRPKPLGRTWTLGAIGVVTLALVAASIWGATRRPAADLPAVALGRIADNRTEGDASAADSILATLARNLRVDGSVRVIDLDGARDALSSLASGADLQGALVAAAQRAGARELVDGALYSTPDGNLRLDLRRTHLASGTLRAVESAAAIDAVAIADSAASHLITALGYTRAGRRSFAAERLHNDGLRAYYHGDRIESAPSFEGALAEDSAFALAAYYWALATPLSDSSLRQTRFQRASTLATNARYEDRLTVLAGGAYALRSSRVTALADTMMQLLPQDAEAHLTAARSLLVSNRLLDARVLLERAVALDIVASGHRSNRCIACDALEDLVAVYVAVDSLAAAVRTAQTWVRLAPASTAARAKLDSVLSR